MSLGTPYRRRSASPLRWLLLGLPVVGSVSLGLMPALPGSALSNPRLTTPNRPASIVGELK